jgi:hypothetical protein
MKRPLTLQIHVRLDRYQVSPRSVVRVRNFRDVIERDVVCTLEFMNTLTSILHINENAY